MRVRQGGAGFEVTVPYYAPEADIAAFVRGNQAWMDAQCHKLMTWTPVYAPGERHLLFGEYVTLGENGIPVGSAFLRWRQAQLEALVGRLWTVYQARLRLAAVTFSYREMKSRWGSCSPRSRSIHLNKKLALTPPKCVEAVLVHELTHLRHPDHSNAFYAAVRQAMPDYDRWDKLLSRLDLRPLMPSEREV